MFLNDFEIRCYVYAMFNITTPGCRPITKYLLYDHDDYQTSCCNTDMLRFVHVSALKPQYSL